MGEAIGRQGKDQRIGVAELVIEEGTVDARRKRVADIVNLLAHLIPEIGHRLCGDRVLEVDEHHRLAGLGVAAQEVEIGELFELLLDPVGNLAQGVGGGCTGPQRLDDHGLDGEGGVLLAAEPAVGPKTRSCRDEHQVDDEALIAQSPVGKIETDHNAPPSLTRTFWSSRSRLTPAVTTTSPFARPSPTTTRSVS